MRQISLTIACAIGLMALLAVLVGAQSSRFDEAKVPAPSTVEDTSLIASAATLSHRYWDFDHRDTSSTTEPSVGSGRTAAVYTTTIDLSTYPYTRCLLPAEAGVAGVRYQALDWECMFTVGAPVSQTYTLLVLSNDYLSVTLLPELGGRVYEMIFKPTGNNELYRNPVLKPTTWGPPEQGWWLAAGGMEWGFPTDEHGYEWGVPWRYQIVSSPNGVTVTLRDSQTVLRPTVAVAVHLPSDRAALLVRPTIVNPTGEPVGVKYWTNAMLAPGAANAPSADLRFLFPTEQVIIHSTDDVRLPLPGEVMNWPEHDGRDYSRLGNWNQFLGFFEAPQAHGPFAGVYDEAADEGVMRVFPPVLAQGSKAYGLGWGDPLPPWVWTDDASAYVELHGGLMPTFWDTATLSAGQTLSWTEVWYPVAGVGAVSAATEAAAMRLEQVDGTIKIGLFTPALHNGVNLYLWRDDCSTLGHWHLSRVDPAHPVVITLSSDRLSPEALSLVAFSSDGAVLGGVNPRDCVPPSAAVEPLPNYVTNAQFAVTWRGDDYWSGITDYDVQFRDGYEGRWRGWLTATRSVSATFTGADGQTYFFRARARDAAGNVGPFGDEEWGQTFTSVLLTPSPVLATSRKLAEHKAPAVGQSVSYTLLLSNTGNRAATSFVLTDRLPSTLKLISGTLTAGDENLPDPVGRVITWQGTLSHGQEFRLRYGVGATSATPLGVPLTNTFLLATAGKEALSRSTVVVFYYRRFLPVAAKNPVTP